MEDTYVFDGSSQNRRVELAIPKKLLQRPQLKNHSKKGSSQPKKQKQGLKFVQSLSSVEFQNGELAT